MLRETPLDRVKKAAEPEDVRQPLTDEELEQVRFAAGRSGSREQALIVLGAGGGLRLNELREARVGDLNLRACQITVRAMTSKVRRSRVVDFHVAVARELDRYLRTRHGVSENDPLFPTDEGKTFSSPDSFAKLFARIARDSGVRDFSAHILRHTWATNFMKQPGADLLTLMRQGGWKRLEMAQRYAHAIPIKDRTSLPNPMAEAKIIQYRRAADSEKPS